jgi:hypothetical protein
MTHGVEDWSPFFYYCCFLSGGGLGTVIAVAVILLFAVADVFVVGITKGCLLLCTYAIGVVGVGVV